MPNQQRLQALLAERGPAAMMRLHAIPDRLRARSPLALFLCRYGAGVAGVAVVTWLISLVLPHYRIDNISMVYLLLVLALAVFAGRGPAILASVLSFLAFDWFFVKPVSRFTVDDPAEWLALFLFLAVAVITGQLAASLRRRAEEAQRRARELTMLYELSISILSDARLQHILQVIAERLRTALNLENVAILLSGASDELETAAEIGAPLSPAGREEREIGARWALSGSAGTSRYSVRQAPIATFDEKDSRIPSGERRRVSQGAYLPILLGAQPLGVLAVLGDPEHAAFGDEQGRVLQAFAAQTALAIGRDRLVQEEERAQAAAESERMKSIFLAAVSHDLRSPLTAIRTAASALGRGTEPHGDPAHEDLTTSIEHEVDRLDRLVRNLLEMSRIETGGLPLRRQLEDLAELLGAAVHRLTPALASHPLAITVADDLPLVPLDVVQIDRVLTNLLENAAKFSPETSEVRIEAWREGSHALLRMHNAGPHLSERELQRIFDRFYRLERSGVRPRGTGLGLAICKGIVEAHGGRIWAENDADGVSFLLSLPLGEKDGERTASLASTQPGVRS